MTEEIETNYKYLNKKEILKNNKEFFQPVIYKVNVDVIEKDTLDIM